MSDIYPRDSASNTTTTTTATTVVKGKKRARSIVWDHFILVEGDDKAVACKHCPKHDNKYAYKNRGTSNLMTHLTNQHSSELNMDPKDSKQQRIDLMIERPQQKYSVELFEELLVKFIVKTDQPFQLIESADFQALLHLLRPSISIFSRKTLKTRIMDAFESKKQSKAEMYAKLTVKVSFTTDIWTSPSNLAFMGITVHYIDQHWKMVAETLDFAPLPGKHDGVSIYEAFVSILDSFNLKNKILGITLDNASNNNSFIEWLDMDDDTSFFKFNHIRCFAHVNNLASQRALDIIKEDLMQLRAGIRKIRSSPQLFLQFKETQTRFRKENDTLLKPILDMPVR